MNHKEQEDIWWHKTYQERSNTEVEGNNKQ